MDPLDADNIWRMFCQTGEPSLFVLYKESERLRQQQSQRDEPEKQENNTTTM